MCIIRIAFQIIWIQHIKVNRYWPQLVFQRISCQSSQLWHARTDNMDFRLSAISNQPKFTVTIQPNWCLFTPSYWDRIPFSAFLNSLPAIQPEHLSNCSELFAKIRDIAAEIPLISLYSADIFDWIARFNSIYLGSSFAKGVLLYKYHLKPSYLKRSY